MASEDHPVLRRVRLDHQVEVSAQALVVVADGGIAFTVAAGVVGDQPVTLPRQVPGPVDHVASGSRKPVAKQDRRTFALAFAGQLPAPGLDRELLRREGGQDQPFSSVAFSMTTCLVGCSLAEPSSPIRLTTSRPSDTVPAIE